jgi:hypothetical protein
LNNSFGEDFVYAKQRRNQGSEESYSCLLINGDSSTEGDVDMAAGREEGDQGQQAADVERDPALDVKHQTLDNPSHHRSAHSAPVPVVGLVRNWDGLCP